MNRYIRYFGLAVVVSTTLTTSFTLAQDDKVSEQEIYFSAYNVDAGSFLQKAILTLIGLFNSEALKDVERLHGYLISGPNGKGNIDFKSLSVMNLEFAALVAADSSNTIKVKGVPTVVANLAEYSDQELKKHLDDKFKYCTSSDCEFYLATLAPLPSNLKPVRIWVDGNEIKSLTNR